MPQTGGQECRVGTSQQRLCHHRSDEGRPQEKHIEAYSAVLQMLGAFNEARSWTAMAVFLKQQFFFENLSFRLPSRKISSTYVQAKNAKIQRIALT